MSQRDNPDRIGRVNRILLTAVAYALLVNLALHLRHRYEAVTFVLIGGAHICSRLFAVRE